MNQTLMEREKNIKNWATEKKLYANLKIDKIDKSKFMNKNIKNDKEIK